MTVKVYYEREKNPINYYLPNDGFCNGHGEALPEGKYAGPADSRAKGDYGRVRNGLVCPSESQGKYRKGSSDSTAASGWLL